MQRIAIKLYSGERISPEEGLVLFEKGSPAFLGSLANHVRERMHGDKVFFNRNFHIEPTNVCVFTCNFCSYSRLYAKREEGWELSIDEMLNIVKKYVDIMGGTLAYESVLDQGTTFIVNFPHTA